MSQSTLPARGLRDPRRLLVLAWASAALPLLAFGYLTWVSYQARQEASVALGQVEQARKSKVQLESEIANLEQQKRAAQNALDEQRASTKHYRDYAGIRIQFYRESDRVTVQAALKELGFNVTTSLGSAPLISESPNTLAFGSQVSPQDLRDIAIALVRAKFPLRRMRLATVRDDPKLIQIFASARSRNCGLLDEAAIRALTDEDIAAGRACGANGQ